MWGVYCEKTDCVITAPHCMWWLYWMVSLQATYPYSWDSCRNRSHNGHIDVHQSQAYTGTFQTHGHKLHLLCPGDRSHSLEGGKQEEFIDWAVNSLRPDDILQNSYSTQFSTHQCFVTLTELGCATMIQLDDYSALGEVKAWCHQATDHYLTKYSHLLCLGDRSHSLEMWRVQWLSG